MGYTLADTVITALLSFFLKRCPILSLMVNTPIHHLASVHIPLLFPSFYRNYDLTVNGLKNVKTYQITVIWLVFGFTYAFQQTCVHFLYLTVRGFYHPE